MLNNVVPRKDTRIKYVEEPVDDLPIKVVMMQKSMDERIGKKRSVDIGKRMVILEEAIKAEKLKVSMKY